MPKAAVNKNHLLACGKNHIRVTWQIGAMKAVAVTHPVHQATHQHFGLHTLAFDALHVP